MRQLRARACGHYAGSPATFQVSVFYGPEFHARGVPFAVGTVALIWFALRPSARPSAWIGACLIVLGNLGQGGLDTAFRHPFYGSGEQYYHEAIAIDS